MQSAWRTGETWETGLLGTGLSVHLGASFLLAVGSITPTYLGDRENYCKWKGQVALVSRDLDLGST